MTEDLKGLALDAIATSAAADDPDYPRFHVVPPVGRLNDPNGLLVDGGTFHAFYQFSPFHPHRKLVYWGHSSSADLLHWRHHEPTIVPDSFYDRSGAYSGNAIVLEGREIDDAPARAPYQLFYTGNLKDPLTDERTASQCLVTSGDLTDFAKWPGNPLIPTNAEGYTAHYRDPQVFRDPDRPGEYRMLIGVQRANESGAAVLYRSRDLVSWEPEGELTFPDAGGVFDSFGYMWECPGLVRVTDEDTGEDWDVLIWCPQGIAPQTEGFENIFPCVYTVGHLVGTELRDTGGAFHEVDRGFEFYAPQVFARRPSEPGPVLLTAWAGNASEDDQPSISTGQWVHALSLPRALSLKEGRLIQRPATNLPHDVGRPALVDTALEAGQYEIAELRGYRSWQLRLEADAASDSDACWGLRIGTAESHVDIVLDGGVLRVDRSTSRYAQHGSVRAVTLPEGCAPVLEVIHDRSLTEVFVGDGALTFTLRSFVDVGSSGARLMVEEPLVLKTGSVRTFAPAPEVL
ncbi:GH32 C-terminal domain-containing protein [Actinomyces viscosus]|uniref:glycoside hydrolase family 32 protein n=1 Tax=Actinomyces viscosus TaxID=1656 RepID=UPI0028EB785B|nr:GH32 C-terminal domain-containing protein [Actinomyces viscosus]